VVIAVAKASSLIFFAAIPPHARLYFCSGTRRDEIAALQANTATFLPFGAGHHLWKVRSSKDTNYHLVGAFAVDSVQSPTVAFPGANPPGSECGAAVVPGSGNRSARARACGDDQKGYAWHPDHRLTKFWGTSTSWGCGRGRGRGRSGGGGGGGGRRWRRRCVEIRCHATELASTAAIATLGPPPRHLSPPRHPTRIILVLQPPHPSPSTPHPSRFAAVMFLPTVTPT
jgi:hypothetical protein